MSTNNLKRGLTELGIFVNSLLAFLFASLLLKGIIAFLRYKVILHYSGEAARLNFETICTSSSFSKMWTYSAVYSIYGVGIVISFFCFIIAEVLFKLTSPYKGVLKLFFLWFSLISMLHCFGFVFKGVLLNQEFYYVLKWLHFPSFLIYITAIINIILFFVLVYFRFNRFLYIASSHYLIADTFLKKRFVVINSFIVATIGYVILFSINGFKVKPYEVLELGILLSALFISYFGQKNTKIFTLPGESTHRINLILLILAGGLIFAFNWIKW